jgi:spermidine/putrescine transport system permease protein
MRNRSLAVPYVGWMAVFVVAPLVLIVVYAFTSNQGGGLTFENFRNMFSYSKIFLDSFKLAFFATLICFAIGYPLSCLLAREGPTVRRLAVIFIMLPRASVAAKRILEAG